MDNNKLSSSCRRVLLTHWGGEGIAKLGSGQLYRRRLFETIGFAMTADGTGVNLTNLEGLDGPYTFINADDSREPGMTRSPLLQRTKSIPRGRATRMTRTKWRVIAPAEFADRST